MKLTTAHNHWQRLNDRLQSCYSNAKHSRCPHSQLLAELKRSVWDDPALKNCPRWVRTRLSEASRIALQNCYRNLVWAFRGSDGAIKELDALTRDDQLKVFAGEIKGHHYWKRELKRVCREQLPDGRYQDLIVYEITDRSF
jgi:hypothetical protein